MVTATLGRLKLLGLFGLVVGCATGPGDVAYGRYTSHRYHFDVIGTGSKESAGLMGPGWKLDNFYGSPVPDTAKEGDQYYTSYSLDLDGDSEPDGTQKEHTFELRFENLDDDGVVFLRVIPVSRDLKRTQLPVLMDSFVESLAGGNYESVRLEATRMVVKDKRYASQLISSQRCQLAERDCILATIDLADVDQLRLNPTARTRRLSVVLVRAPFNYKAWDFALPTYLMAGYSNQPGRFDAGVPAFHDLLGRVVIGGKKGLKLAAITTPAAPEDVPAAAGPSAPTAASSAPATLPTPAP